MAKQGKEKKAEPKRAFTLGDLARVVDAVAPERLAEEWDNVGLQVGDPAAAVARVMTCLEVTDTTLAEAKRRRADAIVAHHPLIFRPMSAVTAEKPAARLVMELVRAGIGLIAAHTNLDKAAWGTNEVLAERCGWKVKGPLTVELEPAHYKFVVYVPRGYEGAIIEAIARGGGGSIGAYTHCTFRTPGTGTFLGGEGTDPFIGEAGRLEEAEEYRLETIVPAAARTPVLREVLGAHPYEEPAYEFYPLAPEAGSQGLGCVAELEKAVEFGEFVRGLKRALGLKAVRVSGPKPRRVRKVAVCTGSGGSLLGAVAAAGQTIYVTGEAKYHDAVEAHQRGIAMIEVGHFESEAIVAGPLAEMLGRQEAVRAAGVKVFAAERDLQPFEVE